MIGADGESVLFICDFAPGFDGAGFHGDGVGGTEALVVVLAEALVAGGVAVDVAARVPDRRVHCGVRYLPLGEARGASVVVLVKQWSDRAVAVSGRRLFLATDVHVPDPAGLTNALRWAEVSAALSPYMREALAATVAVPRMRILAPPVQLSDYARSAGGRDSVLLYCSVPDRGLYYLKDVFPSIRRRVPAARLVITSDFSLWGRTAARDAFLRFFEGQPGVEYLGHVTRERLVDEQLRARVMAYPCTFPEGFCLAAAECMAAGAVPVTTGAYALVSTVGEAGVLISGRPRSWLYRRRFVKACVKLLADDAEWEARSSACRARAARICDPSAAARALLSMAASVEIRP